MSENLIDSTLESARTVNDPPGGSSKTHKHHRPENLPEKFWNKELDSIRIDELTNSYLELERQLQSASRQPIPATPDDYQIALSHEIIASDPEVNRRLHSAGFTQEQAQLVYELASERLLPMVSEIASLFEAEAQINRLEQHFGGEQKWREIARQLDAWGRKHLPERVFEALSTTHEGVVAMHRMLTGAEPCLQGSGDAIEQQPSEGRLKQMMRDSRYWRDQDPAFVDRVREGFKRLYQENRR
jgi:hypothetical protein